MPWETMANETEISLNECHRFNKGNVEHDGNIVLFLNTYFSQKPFLWRKMPLNERGKEGGDAEC